jgi:4-alpha-glucanotransferase
MGGGARAFVDFLASAAQSFWQMLPVGPPGYGESPYSAQSAFAGSPMLLSLDALVEQGLLDRDAVAPRAPLAEGRIEYPATEKHRNRCLHGAFACFEGRPDEVRRYDRFCEEQRAWLEDYALFRALKHAHGGVEWTR